MGETIEGFKILDKITKERNARVRTENTDVVKRFCAKYLIDIKINTEYHFTLSKRGFDKMDVYPTSSKIKLHARGNKVNQVDLYPFLQRFYKVNHIQEIKQVVSEQTINGVQTCIDHIEKKLAKIDDNKVHTVLSAILQELAQYL